MNSIGHTRITPKPYCQPVDWRDHFAEACRSLRLGQQPLVSQHTLLTGFKAQYKTLTALPRRQRRLIHRQRKHSLAGVALLSALGAQPALAATINVGGQCTLARAIVSANNDASPRGFCTPGSGADRIVLPRNSTVTLTTVNNVSFGPTGLPTIRTVMTIDGNGSTIRRGASAPDFRILAVAPYGNLRLQEATISGGVAAPDATGDPGFGDGGGLFIAELGTATVVASTISGNKAARAGGGLHNYAYADLTVTNSTVSGNQASGHGGGVYTDEDAGLTIINSTISGNRSGGSGGGVASNNNTLYIMTVAGSTISGNTAANHGGGVYVGYNSGMRITNSTISGNKATDGGGGIRTGYSVSVFLVHSTVTGNTAASGGGVSNYNNSLVELNRSLISGNSASTAREVYNNAVIRAGDYNLLGHGASTNAQAFVNFAPGGTDINATSDGDTPTTLSAILNRSLASNGGTTRTHALVTDSPAIDAINNGTCPPPAVDQRGISRPRDGDGDGGVACDIGSFEVASAPPVFSAKCQGVVATIVGTANDDYLVGTAGRDVIQGLAGNDRLVGLEGDDLICGGKDHDNVYGGPGNDRIYGEVGSDRLLGVDGNDRIFGGSERDTMDGGVGTDRCDGGPPATGDKAANCERVLGVP